MNGQNKLKVPDPSLLSTLILGSTIAPNSVRMHGDICGTNGYTNV